MWQLFATSFHFDLIWTCPANVCNSILHTAWYSLDFDASWNGNFKNISTRRKCPYQNETHESQVSPDRTISLTVPSSFSGVFGWGNFLILGKPEKAPRFWYLQQHSCCCTMHRHLLHRFRMNSFTISFIQRLELDHGWVLSAISFNLPYIFLQNKINIDKIRYEYGGCIYAGWVISCIELLVCPLVWYYRGFSEERQEKKLEKDDKDTEYDKLLEELNAGGLDLTRVSKKLTPYGPMWFLTWLI